MENIIRLSRSLVQKKRNLFLELSSTSVEIWCNAFEDKIISSCPDIPSSQHNQFHENGTLRDNFKLVIIL
jgi:hypothetical protein